MRPDAASKPRRPARRDAGPAPRSPFLDAIGALATVRVITWHASGAPIATAVAAIPLLFFVSGYVFLLSCRRRTVAVVLRDRARRVLVPFWAFGAVAVTTPVTWPVGAGD